MAENRLGFGDLVYLAVAAVPFYIYGHVPLLTFLFVLSGSLFGYRGRPMPMAKQLMVPGFFAGLLGTLAVKLISRHMGYVFMVTSFEALWWSAWFAFLLAPLIITIVLSTRGIRPH